VKTNRNNKPLTGLLESARGFLTNGVTPDVVTFADETLNEVRLIIIPTLQNESIADQAWILSEHGRFQDAIDELEDSNHAILQWNNEVTAASDVHKSCRDLEKVACDEKRGCEMALWNLWMAWVREETELRTIHTQIENHFCVQDEHGNYLANGTLHTFRVASVPWMQSYTDQKGDCDDAEDAYDYALSDANPENCNIKHGNLDTRSATCNANLDDLEGKACAHAGAISQNLRLFHTTWASLHASYQGVTDLVYNQTQDRHQEYKTLIIIECLLDRVHELNGRPCDESTGTVDDQMTTCETRGEDSVICSEMPDLCPEYFPPPATPPGCPVPMTTGMDGKCLPVPQPWPCNPAWIAAEMDGLPLLPEPVFSETNPGCNQYPDCSVCSDVDDLPVDGVTDYQTWVLPPASFSLEHATFDDTANNYAVTYSLWGASVDGCSSDNGNTRDYMGDQTGQAIPVVVHSADETAAVRCCSHDGSTCASQVQGVCHDVASFHDANAICAAANMRLCSQAEMGSGVCCGTGCWFNHFAIWISDGTPTLTPTEPGCDAIATMGGGIHTDGVPDGASAIQFIDLGAGAMPSSGQMQSVRYRVARANQAGLKFQVYRPVSGNTYNLVMESEVLASTEQGSTTTHQLVTALEYQAGDFIGWVHTGQGTFNFHGNSGSVRWKYGIEPVGSDINFNGAGRRTYSYEATLALC